MESVVLSSDLGMEPVDRIQARAEALHTLGLDQTASASEIRAAWRTIAFHAHPDHTDGDCSQFSRAKSAYDFLRKSGLAGKGAGPAKPRRPKLRKRLVELADKDVEACQSLLDPDRALPCGTQDKEETPLRRNSDHIPNAIGCYGRDLTYFVATPVCEGENRVALPTSILAGFRTVETEILSFQAKNGGSGEVVVPDTIRERKFPGARSVKIRFDATQETREQFWQTP